MNLIADINAKKLVYVTGNKLKRSLDDMIEDSEEPTSPTPDPTTGDVVDEAPGSSLGDVVRNDEETSSSVLIPTTELVTEKVIDESANPNVYEHRELAGPSVAQDTDSSLTDSGNMEQNLCHILQSKNCGSSFILEISDKSESNIYKRLFSLTDWDETIKHFENDLVHSITDIDKNMLSKWDYATSLAMLSNDFEESQTYLASQFDASASKKHRSVIKLFTIIVGVIENNSYIMEQKYPGNISEGDYVDQIWLPILKALFSMNGHLVRVKKGGTVTKDSKEQKAVLYLTESHLIGFKIDIRLIYDHGATESDMGVAEACLPEADDNKAADDSAKLLREGKDNTDTLIKVTSSEISHSWTIQISGLIIYIFTVNHVGNDLYVGALQNKIVFPNYIGELNDQNKSLEFLPALLQLRDNIENSAQTVKSCIFQANKKKTQTSTLSCQTWYTPPRKQQKKSVFSEANIELLETGKFAIIESNADMDPSDDEEALGVNRSETTSSADLVVVANIQMRFLKTMKMQKKMNLVSSS